MSEHNPISETVEYRKAFLTYKFNMNFYQPGPRWSFSGFEVGVRFDKTHITLEEMQEYARLSGPIGPAVDISEVVDISPSWKEYCEMTGPTYDYGKFTKWVSEQKDAFHYWRGKEDFNKSEAFFIAARLGYHKVILENLS